MSTTYLSWPSARRRTWASAALLLSLLTLLALPRAGAAAPVQQGLDSADLNPFLQLFPELHRLPAPPWLVEGVRLTYYVQSASITIEEDANGSGGAGYLHHDIVALDSKTAVVASAFYLDAGHGEMTPSFAYGATTLPGVSDNWLNPTVLADAERVANEDLAVVHMPTTVAGVDYQAVRFEYHQDDAVTVYMFDEETGVLLYFRHTVGTDFAADRESSEAYLVQMRTVHLPWQAKRAPTWAIRGLTLAYAGTQDIAVAGEPAAQFPEEMTARIGQTGGRWNTFGASSYLNGAFLGTAVRVTGVTQLWGALWLPAEALKAAVRRPLLDRDPVTGTEVTYRKTGNRIFLTEEGLTHTTTLTYDGRTGQLVAIQSTVQVGLATQVSELTLTE